MAARCHRRRGRVGEDVRPAGGPARGRVAEVVPVTGLIVDLGDRAVGVRAERVDNGCCFDYGNAETNNDDDGSGAMEAIYFGTEKAWGYGSGNGPWIMADMENGLFSGSGSGLNSGDPTIADRFITAMIEGGVNQWAILGGNSDSGSLSTFYSGVRPSGYNPMKKQGAIILGIGGDNSDSSAGTFYEGVMTSGYPSATTEASVQANIVSVGYANYTLPSNPFTIVEPGLANSACVSFESANGSGDYIRHYNFELYLEPNDGTSQFALDATFCPWAGNSGSNYSFMSYNYSYKYIRHYNYIGYVASDGGSNTWDASSLWYEDSTWAVATPWS